MSRGGRKDGGGGRQTAVMDAIHALRKVQVKMHRVLGSIPDQQIALADMLVLHQISHGEGVTPGQIMAATGLTSGAVTSVIDRLQDRGLVTRQRSTEDRRVVVVSLAPDAHARMGRIMATAHKEAARLFEDWSVDRIRTLVQLLEELSGVESPSPG